MNDAPVPMPEAEAIATLRAVARLMSDGFVIRVYARGGTRGEPRHFRSPVGFAAAAWHQRDVSISSPGMAWDERPAWVYDRKVGALEWRAPRSLNPGGYVTWRGIDEGER
jgi:hypothetical protein